MNLIDLNNGEAEDEYIEASYTSEQPLVSCGFIGSTGLAYAITTINTVEIIDLETMCVVKQWNEFNKAGHYVIQGQYVDDQMVFFTGNNTGELFRYAYEPKKSFSLLDSLKIASDNK